MICNHALRFLHRAFRSAMGCFVNCFRGRPDRCLPRTHFVADPVVPKSRKNVGSPTQFTSLLVSEENEESPEREEQIRIYGFQQPEITDRDLQDEAKFLKACGILVETPVDIRKAKEKMKCREEYDSESPDVHSWFPNTSVEKLRLKQENAVEPLTPGQLCEDSPQRVNPREDSSVSCVAEANDSQGSLTEECDLVINTPAIKIQETELDNNPGLLTPSLPSTAFQSRAKSVHFAREPESSSSSSSEKVGRCYNKVKMPYHKGALKFSPYPTPLKLTDEMQTPGTIYPSNPDSATKGRNARIRSQYVYSALNPVEDISQWRILKEEEEGDLEVEDNDLDLLSGTVIESSEHIYETPGQKSGEEETSAYGDENAEPSLAAWLKQGCLVVDGNNESDDITHTKKTGFTPGSRPILGALPAYWNMDKLSEISAKGWDGNGIPNTTTKYKEDQKVTWHATPFVERLEKVLSADTPIPERKHLDGRPLAYDEDGEEEGTGSQLQDMTNHNHVISC